MINSAKILRAVSIFSGTLVSIGFFLFLYGYFASGFPALTGIAIGITMGGVFIFIMGIFLVATEEVVEENKRKTLS